MIDPILSLAFTIHANKGVYALLLGSGISRSANIPTGWDLVLDLIRQLAAAQGKDAGADPADWYRAEYGKEPEYPTLLASLAKQPAERIQLIRPYFEPTAEERRRHQKTPTPAHQAIAELVAGGYVRVIVTTNFDRLLELALQDRGVTPTVISTTDGIAGAKPLAHSACTIIKVNGDYFDTRIRNTLVELVTYEPELDRLLDQVFDEYGLIVCGWSADWEFALACAIERTMRRRYTMYWTSYGEPGYGAKRLITHRDAELIRIRGADPFFTHLAEHVHSLEKMDWPHPLSREVAAATLERYLPDNRERIRLEQLMRRATEEFVSRIAIDPAFSISAPAVTPESVCDRVVHYKIATDLLLHLIIPGCYYGEPHQDFLWRQCVERVASTSSAACGRYMNTWDNLGCYPALLLLYAGGIAAIAGRRYHVLKALLKDARLYHPDRVQPLLKDLDPNMILTEEVGNWLFEGNSLVYFPLQKHLRDYLWLFLSPILPDLKQFELLFDHFEYLWGLTELDRRQREEGFSLAVETAGQGTYFTHGYFVLETLRGSEHAAGAEIQRQIDAERAQWGPVKTGLFADIERVVELKSFYDAYIRSILKYYC